MLRRVTLVRTDVSEERSASIMRVTRIGELETTLAVTSNRRTQRKNAKKYEKYKYNFYFFRSVRRFLVTAKGVVLSLPILVPPKRLSLQEPHGVTSQKTPFATVFVFICTE
jgi:hypothetical protein